MSAGKIFELIPKVMAEIGAIEKTRNNTQGQGYKFRGIDDVYAAVHAPFSKYGIFVAPEVLEHQREERVSKSGGTLIYSILKIKFSFYAEDGSFFPVVTMGEAMDSGDKSCNKAMSVALKYAVIQVFSIPTIEDKDPENHSPDPQPKTAPMVAAYFNTDTHNQSRPISTEMPHASSQRPRTSNGPTEPQIKRLWAIARQSNWTSDDVKAYSTKEFKIESSKDLSKAQYDKLCGWIESNPRSTAP